MPAFAADLRFFKQALRDQGAIINEENEVFVAYVQGFRIRMPIELAAEL